MSGKEVVDANIPNAVDQDAVKQRLKGDHYVAQFTKFGKELLEETEKPNLITYEQFEPFIELFNADRARLETDENYRSAMSRLYNQYVKGLGINLYQPTIVILSKEDPQELYFLDRVYTRFMPDVVDGNSMRDTVPSAVSKTANTTRDQLLLEASVRDLVEANNTPEQKEYFTRIRMESALINANFVERNLSPEKRAELLGDKEAEGEIAPTSTSGMNFILDDDD